MSEAIYSLLEKRRSVYAIGKKKVVSNERLKEIVGKVIQETPTAFNSQSARTLLLLDDASDKFWDMVKAQLKKIVPAEQFSKTEEKIDGFKAGYLTILFFEDQGVVKSLQEQFPLYKENFPVWSLQSNGMLQNNLWLVLSAEGLGGSLQHYTEVIEEETRKMFSIDPEWKFIAQMPFGSAEATPEEKEKKPLDELLWIYEN